MLQNIVIIKCFANCRQQFVKLKLKDWKSLYHLVGKGLCVIMYLVLLSKKKNVIFEVCDDSQIVSINLQKVDTGLEKIE